MKKIILSLGLLALVYSCEKGGQKGPNEYENQETTEMVASSEAEQSSEKKELTSKAAEQKVDGKEFIVKSSIDLEVEDSYKSTVNIENKAIELGGFVEKSNLNSNVIRKKEIELNEKESKEIKTYNTKGNLIVRVPTIRLNEFLMFLGKDVSFINSRIIEADDVTLMKLGNSLDARNNYQNKQDLEKLSQERGRIQDKKDIVESKAQVQSDLNDNIIKHKALANDIKYSQVSITLEDKPKQTVSVITNTSYDFKSSSNISYQLSKALSGGLFLLRTIFIGLLYVWPIWIILIAFFVGRNYIRKNKK